MSGKEFLRNYLETVMEETDEEHFNKFAAIVTATSEKFKKEVEDAVIEFELEEAMKRMCDKDLE